MDELRVVVFVPTKEEFKAVVHYFVEKAKDTDNFWMNYMEMNEDSRLAVSVGDKVYVFVQSGIGVVNSAIAFHKELGKQIVNSTVFYVIGTAAGENPGVYSIEKACDDIDLTAFGNKKGSYDNIEASVNLVAMPNMKKASSLTVNKFVTEFPNKEDYGVEGEFLVDMEDYMFARMAKSIGASLSIFRGVSDKGDPEEWSNNTEKVINEILSLIIK